MTASPAIPARRVRVAAITPLAEGVLRYDLVSADGRALPPFEAGAHIDVHVPLGPVRQYSLIRTAPGTEVYAIAVRRDEAGRGGSIALHDSLEKGTIFGIGAPRQNFPLAADAGESVFIAGGIGITPIQAMIFDLHARGAPWVLHYCARSRQHAAFADELAALAPDRVHFYFGGEARLDVAALLGNVPADAHVYCCGPAGLMGDVAAASADRAPGRVHFEWFSAPAGEYGAKRPFEVELRSSGRTLTVPADRTLLEVLRDNDIDLPSSCEEGICGTCEVRVLSGQAEHRDAILTDAEREAGETMMACVSRAQSDKLILDL